MESRDIERGIEGLLMVLTCLALSVGVGLVMHSVGWSLIALGGVIVTFRFIASRI